MKSKNTIILASASPSRAMILKNAGVEFEIHPAAVDEAKIKIKGRQKNYSAADLGMDLARQKALKISKGFPEALVIGADQILEFRGEIFDKPKTMDEARKTLLRLRGKTHRLISCVAVAQRGAVQREIQKHATLFMRNFSDLFLETYLNQAGEAILTSVGGYQLEGLGAGLFEKIEGDFFTILGLPLLEVQAALYDLGALDE